MPSTSSTMKRRTDAAAPLPAPFVLRHAPLQSVTFTPAPGLSRTSSTIDSPREPSPLVHCHLSCSLRRPSGRTPGVDSNLPVISSPPRLTWP